MIPKSVSGLLKKKASDMMPSGFDFGPQEKEEEDSDISSFLDNKDIRWRKFRWGWSCGWIFKYGWRSSWCIWTEWWFGQRF